MKTIDVSSQSKDLRELLDAAKREDVLVRTPDGREFMVTAVDDFDLEIAATRRNTKLMALLDERAKQTETVPLEQVKRELGIGDTPTR